MQLVAALAGAGVGAINRETVKAATAVAVTDRVYMMPSDWQALQAQQEATLHSYGWVDRQAGVVHIPIDQAIDLVLQRGLPVRGQP